MSVKIKTTGLSGDTYLIPYKSYIAIMTQSGTSTPVANVIENSFDGEPVWSRNDVGVYKATLAGAFPANSDKLIFYPFGAGQSGNAVGFVNGTNMYQLGSGSADECWLYTYLDNSFTFAELSSFNCSVYIEIRVYP